MVDDCGWFVERKDTSGIPWWMPDVYKKVLKEVIDCLTKQ